jgi:hypothetical protein
MLAHPKARSKVIDGLSASHHHLDLGSTILHIGLGEILHRCGLSSLASNRFVLGEKARQKSPSFSRRYQGFFNSPPVRRFSKAMIPGIPQGLCGTI